MAKLKILARIEAKALKSLVWEGDQLVDWASGGARFELDGTHIPRAVFFAFGFDAACVSPSSQFTAIYKRLGTKGAVLKDGKLIREINRSYYCADVYEYPVCIAQLESGREVLIHCPDEYNRLEIEDVETGERLTHSDARKPADYFHSRLSLDAGNHMFLSAGWIWHPVDALGVYSLDAALRDPRTLDSFGLLQPQPTEISSASFVGGNRILLSTSDESFEDESELGENDLRTNSIAVWDLSQEMLISQAKTSEPVGILMGVDSKIAVGFYENPKLVDLSTGAIIDRLSDVNSGKQVSSIIHHIDSIPPMALDADNRRFAIASDSEIIVGCVE